MRPGLLNEYPPFKVVGEAEDGIMAMQMAEFLRPDVVLRDVHISRIDGVTATRRINALLPRTAIIRLSAILSPQAEKGMFRGRDLIFVQKERVWKPPSAATRRTDAKNCMRVLAM